MELFYQLRSNRKITFYLLFEVYRGCFWCLWQLSSGQKNLWQYSLYASIVGIFQQFTSNGKTTFCVLLEVSLLFLPFMTYFIDTKKFLTQLAEIAGTVEIFQRLMRSSKITFYLLFEVCRGCFWRLWQLSSVQKNFRRNFSRNDLVAIVKFYVFLHVYRSSFYNFFTKTGEYYRAKFFKMVNHSSCLG